MHIPDGFVNAPVALSTGVLSAGAFAYAVRRVGRGLPASRTALLGVSAAFIFAAQMINFPVAAGTSGHLVGGTLAAVLLGPSAALIAMIAVVLLQCFIFADGGITALGANAFNMAVLAPMAGYSVYRAVLPLVRGRTALAAAIAGWFSTMAAAAACAGQIALSGKSHPGLIMPAMLYVHAVIGIGEGVITGLVIAGIERSRPELLTPSPNSPRAATWPVLVFGSVIAAGLAIFVAPFASPMPDGLERVAETLGFHAAAVEPMLPGLIPDYAWHGIGSPTIATAIAGAVGTLLVLVVALMLARLLRSSPAAAPAENDVRAD